MESGSDTHTLLDDGGVRGLPSVALQKAETQRFLPGRLSHGVVRTRGRRARTERAGGGDGRGKGESETIHEVERTHARRSKRLLGRSPASWPLGSRT